MDRQISFKEHELFSRLTFLTHKVDLMEAEIGMMEEQALGLRDNLDWKNSAINLRTALETVKGIINEFKVVEAPYCRELQNPTQCFTPFHVEMIQKRSKEIDQVDL